MRTLSAGRVRRSREEWERIVERYHSSGLTEAAFCRREKIAPNRLSVWVSKIPRVPTTAASFVDVTPVETRAARFGDFELELPGGVTLRWRA
jgi:transposase-like protein